MQVIFEIKFKTSFLLLLKNCHICEQYFLVTICTGRFTRLNANPNKIEQIFCDIQKDGFTVEIIIVFIFLFFELIFFLFSFWCMLCRYKTMLER
jgi:hypothetical protein